MEGTIQLIQISPAELQNQILEGVKQEIQSLKEEYQPKEPESYLTRKEVSKLLKINLSTIYSWQRKGILKPFGIAGRVYFKRSDIEECLTALE